MKVLFLFLASLYLCCSTIYAASDKKVIPKDEKWEETNDRDTSVPQLYQDDSSVYVYSEKEVDNLTIGITDMQGNTYHYEVTTLPAGTYYAISIESLPVGQYYLCIYLGTGSNAWFYQDTPVYNGDNYTSNRKIHIVTPN